MTLTFLNHHLLPICHVSLNTRIVHSLEQELSSLLLISTTFDTKEALAHTWAFLRLLQNSQLGLDSFVHLCVPRNQNNSPPAIFSTLEVGHVLATVHKSWSCESLWPSDLLSNTQSAIMYTFSHQSQVCYTPYFI